MTKNRIGLSFVLLPLFLLIHCGSPYRSAKTEANLPLVSEHTRIAEQTKVTGFSKTDTLTLDEAVSRALQWNRELQALKTGIKVSEATTLQESLLPNPEFSLEMENFAGLIVALWFLPVILFVILPLATLAAWSIIQTFASLGARKDAETDVERKLVRDLKSTGARA